jgi:RND family efflux transporter MFP subunit
MMNKSTKSKGWKRLSGTTALLGAGALGWFALAGRGPQEVEGEAVKTLTLSAENVHIADRQWITAGPMLSGSLQPERHATVRAEVGGAVIAMLVEPGTVVRQGQIVARIDDAALTDALLAARSAVRTATDNATVARRNEARMTALHAAGAVPLRDVESATTASLSAEAQLAEAGTSLAHAQKQLAKTVIHAPLSGIVSERPAAAGDVVQPGAPLLTVVDPASMQLEATVPSDQLSSVVAGTKVDFRVRGYGDRTFEGRIDRVNPVVDPVSRQVKVFVSIPNENGPLVGGLFADGRIALESREGIVVPAGVVQTTSSGTTVMRVRGGVIESAAVQTGLRDARNERMEIVSGVMAGDTLLAGAARSVTPGTMVVISTPTMTAVASR